MGVSTRREGGITKITDTPTISTSRLLVVLQIPLHVEIKALDYYNTQANKSHSFISNLPIETEGSILSTI